MSPSDATPIEIPRAAPVFDQSATVQSTEAAWTGASWAVTYSLPVTGSLFDDRDVWLIRVAPDGTVLDPTPIAADAGPSDDDAPVVAGGGGGDLLLAYNSTTTPNQKRDDIRATRVAADGTPEPFQEVSLGLPRQEHLDWVRGDGVHLALYTSRSSGTTRVLAQRFDDAGAAVDPVPVLVHQGFETLAYAPAGAWNGTHYLVTWLDATGLVLGRRLTADLQVLGFGATPLMMSMNGAPDTSALGSNFLVVAADLFSGDQRVLRGVRVSGATGAPIEAAPFTVSGDYALDPVVETLGGEWLVVWASKTCHDCTTVRVFARRIAASGALLGGSAVINGPGEGVSPSVAVAADRALVAWEDDSSSATDRVEGRLLMAGGGFLGGEFVIGDAPGEQKFPSVAFDGARFVVAWADFRTVTGVEQLRGDVYAARVDLDGTVLDPAGGFAVETSPLPEDYPAVAGAGDRALIAYLALDGVGGVPEVQRIRFRELTGGAFCQQDLGFGGPGTATLSVCGEPLIGPGVADLVIDTDLPGAAVFLAYGTSFLPTPLLGGTVVPVPPIAVGGLVADAQGDASIPGLQAGGVPLELYVQAIVPDAVQPQGFQITNAVKIVFTP